MFENSIEFVVHTVEHLFHDIPAEIAAAVLMKTGHHAVRHASGLHIIERVKKIHVQVHTGEHVSARVTRTTLMNMLRRRK